METEEKYFLKPGYIFVSDQPYLIYTVLGSCVSVCLWDSVKKIGGINHFILSKARPGFYNARYGDASIKHLIRIMFQMGCQAKNLRAHIVGGGQNPELHSKIGDDNVIIAEEILNKYMIEIVTRDTGGKTGRKLIFYNTIGEIIVYKGINIRKSDWDISYEE